MMIRNTTDHRSEGTGDTGMEHTLKGNVWAKPIRDQILDVAGALFYREGIRAVGIDRLIRETKVAKATLYRHFPSKTCLVESYLLERHERVIASLEEVLILESTPYARTAQLFDRLYEKADAPEFRGCAFALAVGEHGETESIVRIAQMHKAKVRAILRQIAEPLGPSADQIATHLALLYEGALATVAVQRDNSALKHAKKIALSLFPQ